MTLLGRKLYQLLLCYVISLSFTIHRIVCALLFILFSSQGLLNCCVERDERVTLPTVNRHRFKLELSLSFSFPSPLYICIYLLLAALGRMNWEKSSWQTDWHVYTRRESSSHARVYGSTTTTSPRRGCRCVVVIVAVR